MRFHDIREIDCSRVPHANEAAAALTSSKPKVVVNNARAMRSEMTTNIPLLAAQPSNRSEILHERLPCLLASACQLSGELVPYPQLHNNKAAAKIVHFIEQVEIQPPTFVCSSMRSFLLCSCKSNSSTEAPFLQQTPTTRAPWLPNLLRPSTVPHKHPFDPTTTSPTTRGDQ